LDVVEYLSKYVEERIVASTFIPKAFMSDILLRDPVGGQ
jgi:hypothetical protein